MKLGVVIMKQLLKVNKIVKQILTDIPATRNSDSYLYLKVLEKTAEMHEFELENMSVTFFLNNVKQLKCPYFETVRRARQKIQAECPELRSSKAVQDVKDSKEKVYRAYARASIR